MLRWHKQNWTKINNWNYNVCGYAKQSGVQKNIHLWNQNEVDDFEDSEFIQSTHVGWPFLVEELEKQRNRERGSAFNQTYLFPILQKRLFWKNTAP